MFEDPAAYREAVADLIRSHDVNVLIPMTDSSVRALLPISEMLPSVTVPFPTLEQVLKITDKSELSRIAAQLGVSVPQHRTLRALQDRETELPGGLTFPVVIKPSRSVTQGPGGFSQHIVQYATGPTKLHTVLESLPREAYPVLLQERIEGPGVGVFVLLWEGEVRAVFAHRRLREKPPSGGVSVFRESIAADPELVRQSVALLRSCDWNGVAMVEYKVDEATGIPYLMEVNGRFWGSLQLAIDAGVDFPRLLLEAASGAPFAPPPDYRTGVRTRWLWGDVDNLLARLRHPDRWRPFLPAGSGRMDAFRDFLLAFGPGSREELFRFEDPAPFLLETFERIRSGASALHEAVLELPVARTFGQRRQARCDP